MPPIAGRATLGAEKCPSARTVVAARPLSAGVEQWDPAVPEATAFRPGREERADRQVRYVGQSEGIEESLVRRTGASFVSIATGQIRGRSPWVMLRNVLRMARGVRECSALIDDFRPDVIFITGGYVTVPLAVAAWRSRRRVPLLIYLPDLTPGLAVRWTSHLATRVAVSFPEVAHFFPSKAVVTGYPVRQELLAADKRAARAQLGLSEAPVVLVFGGSRGAHSINEALINALPALLETCQVVHVSGQDDWSWIDEVSARQTDDLRERYHPYPYLHDEMIPALAAADLVVARAGASTLGEFPARHLPSILVPYPYAGQHQRANAAYLADRGAALIIEDGELANRLAPAVQNLLADRGRLANMAQAAGALAYPAAAADIARQLMELAGS